MVYITSTHIPLGETCHTTQRRPGNPVSDWVATCQHYDGEEPCIFGGQLVNDKEKITYKDTGIKTKTKWFNPKLETILF